MFLKLGLTLTTVCILILGYLLVPPKLSSHSYKYPNHNLTTNPIILVSSKPVISPLLSVTISPTLSGSLSCSNLTTCQFNQSESYAYSTTYKVQYKYLWITIAEFELQSPPIETLESIFQKNALEITKSYPLAYKLPYITENIKISYLGPLKLEVKYQGISEDDALNQVRQFMEMNNLTPTSHTNEVIHLSF